MARVLSSVYEHGSLHLVSIEACAGNTMTMMMVVMNNQCWCDLATGSKQASVVVLVMWSRWRFVEDIADGR